MSLRLYTQTMVPGTQQALQGHGQMCYLTAPQSVLAEPLWPARAHPTFSLAIP